MKDAANFRMVAYQLKVDVIECHKAINAGIELDRLAGDALDVLANGTMIAKGEVVMVGERFGIRFTEIVDPAARMESI